MMLYPPHLWLFLFFLLSRTVADEEAEHACSADKPCTMGCCNKDHECGFGPSFCSPETCLSSCDQKSECNPGWGEQWSQNNNCPLNICKCTPGRLPPPSGREKY